MGSGWSRGSIRVRRQPFVFCLWLEEEGSRTKASMACWTHPTPCPHGFSSTPPTLPPANAGWGRLCSYPEKTQRPLLKSREHQKTSKAHRQAAVGARALGAPPPPAGVCLSFSGPPPPHWRPILPASSELVLAPLLPPRAQPSAQCTPGPRSPWYSRSGFCFDFF